MADRTLPGADDCHLPRSVFPSYSDNMQQQQELLSFLRTRQARLELRAEQDAVNFNKFRCSLSTGMNESTKRLASLVNVCDPQKYPSAEIELRTREAILLETFLRERHINLVSVHVDVGVDKVLDRSELQAYVPPIKMENGFSNMQEVVDSLVDYGREIDLSHRDMRRCMSYLISDPEMHRHFVSTSRCSLGGALSFMLALYERSVSLIQMQLSIRNFKRTDTETIEEAFLRFSKFIYVNSGKLHHFLNDRQLSYCLELGLELLTHPSGRVILESHRRVVRLNGWKFDVSMCLREVRQVELDEEMWKKQKTRKQQAEVQAMVPASQVQKTKRPTGMREYEPTPEHEVQQAKLYLMELGYRDNTWLKDSSEDEQAERPRGRAPREATYEDHRAYRDTGRWPARRPYEGTLQDLEITRARMKKILLGEDNDQKEGFPSGSVVPGHIPYPDQMIQRFQERRTGASTDPGPPRSGTPPWAKMQQLTLQPSITKPDQGDQDQHLSRSRSREVRTAASTVAVKAARLAHLLQKRKVEEARKRSKSVGGWPGNASPPTPKPHSSHLPKLPQFLVGGLVGQHQRLQQAVPLVDEAVRMYRALHDSHHARSQAEERRGFVNVPHSSMHINLLTLEESKENFCPTCRLRYGPGVAHSPEDCPDNPRAPQRQCERCDTNHPGRCLRSQPSPHDAEQICGFCSQAGHMADNCPNRRRDPPLEEQVVRPTRPPRPILTCRSCGMVGHEFLTCWNNPSAPMRRCRICRTRHSGRCEEPPPEAAFHCTHCQDSDHHMNDCPRNPLAPYRACEVCMKNHHGRCMHFRSSEDFSCTRCRNNVHDTDDCPQIIPRSWDAASPIKHLCPFCYIDMEQHDHDPFKCPDYPQAPMRECTRCKLTHAAQCGELNQNRIFPPYCTYCADFNHTITKCKLWPHRKTNWGIENASFFCTRCRNSGHTILNCSQNADTPEQAKAKQEEEAKKQRVARCGNCASRFHFTGNCPHPSVNQVAMETGDYSQTTISQRPSHPDHVTGRTCSCQGCMRAIETAMRNLNAGLALGGTASFTIPPPTPSQAASDRLTLRRHDQLQDFSQDFQHLRLYCSFCNSDQHSENHCLQRTRGVPATAAQGTEDVTRPISPIIRTGLSRPCVQCNEQDHDISECPLDIDDVVSRTGDIMLNWDHNNASQPHGRPYVNDPDMRALCYSWRFCEVCDGSRHMIRDCPNRHVWNKRRMDRKAAEAASRIKRKCRQCMTEGHDLENCPMDLDEIGQQANDIINTYNENRKPDGSCDHDSRMSTLTYGMDPCELCMEAHSRLECPKRKEDKRKKLADIAAAAAEERKKWTRQPLSREEIRRHSDDYFNQHNCKRCNIYGHKEEDCKAKACELCKAVGHTELTCKARRASSTRRSIADRYPPRCIFCKGRSHDKLECEFKVMCIHCLSYDHLYEHCPTANEKSEPSTRTSCPCCGSTDHSQSQCDRLRSHNTLRETEDPGRTLLLRADWQPLRPMTPMVALPCVICMSPEHATEDHPSSIINRSTRVDITQRRRHASGDQLSLETGSLGRRRKSHTPEQQNNPLPQYVCWKCGEAAPALHRCVQCPYCGKWSSVPHPAEACPAKPMTRPCPACNQWDAHNWPACDGRPNRDKSKDWNASPPPGPIA